MKNYVLGFLFSKEGHIVAMIGKTKPVWQAGKLNGVGGKVEPGEGPHEAMVREFREETGVHIPKWEQRFTMGRPGDFEMTVFRAYSDKVFKVATMTEEKVWLCQVPDLLKGLWPKPPISNMSWVLPLVLDNEVISGKISY